MKKYILIVSVLFFISACRSGKKSESQEVLVFCAASLTNVITEIAEEFEAQNNISIQLNFASSGTLARQIEHGAKPSIYISANKKWVTYLNETGKTIPEYEKELAGNSLVVIAPLNSELGLFQFNADIDFPKMFGGRLSIGDPKHVPAGDYTMQVMEKMGFKNALENMLLPAKDVRSALLVVELGETEAGVVYKTDALKSKKVKIIAEIPDNLHASIVYYLSMVKDSKNKNSILFYEFLNSEAIKKIWLKNGFKV